MDMKHLITELPSGKKLITNRPNFPIKDTENFINLMNVYLEEWKHRDSIFIKQTFIFFFASFIVILLPYTDLWGINLVKFIPSYVFPIAGMLLSLIYLFISRQYAKRFDAIADAYQKLQDMVPLVYRRKRLYKLKDKKSRNESIKKTCKLKNRKSKTNPSWHRLSFILPYTMFGALICFAVLVLILSIFSKQMPGQQACSQLFIFFIL